MDTSQYHTHGDTRIPQLLKRRLPETPGIAEIFGDEFRLDSSVAVLHHERQAAESPFLRVQASCRVRFTQRLLRAGQRGSSDSDSDSDCSLRMRTSRTESVLLNQCEQVAMELTGTANATSLRTKSGL